jgi:2-dehydro-3-deoxyphosphogluconate aldolase/(4S)-4-hydroxy-2-oxoglutarate aldolase
MDLDRRSCERRGDFSMTDTLSLADHGPVIPVIVIDRVADAVPLAQALLAGGVRVLEVTLRTPVALQAIREIVAAVPEAIVGAGTLRTAADVNAARQAGCSFGVSPGLTPALARACRDTALPLLPGVATASEVLAAQDEGLSFLKFFPATAAGGLPLLKALAGPFPDISFCPTGGITPETAPQFLALGNVRVCGGSWLTPADAVAAGDWARITALARAASALRG